MGQESGARDIGETGEEAAAFELARFFPYRLAVLAERVSQAVSQVYADRFDLGRAEWRVLAALAVNHRMAAKDVAPYSTLDKMQVSRAVARLEKAGWVRREDDPDDGRSQLLVLTRSGRALFDKVRPLVTAREDYLLEVLDAEERRVLDLVLTKVLARAEDLVRRG